MSDIHVNYDQVAPTYDQRYEALEYEGVASTLESLARSCHADRILEVGCGTGHWAAYLLTADRQVYGLDVSLGMLKQADQRIRGCLVCGRAGHLPFPARSLALVFCANAFHHFDEKQEFLLQARHALRPGGTLAIIGMDPHNAGHNWYLHDYFEATYETDLARYPSADSIGTWMTEAGFVQVSSGVAERLVRSVTGPELLQSPFLQKQGTSQLALLTEEAYQAGLERIKAAIRDAESGGETLHFVVDICLALVTGSAP